MNAAVDVQRQNIQFLANKRLCLRQQQNTFVLQKGLAQPGGKLNRKKWKRAQAENMNKLRTSLTASRGAWRRGLNTEFRWTPRCRFSLLARWCCARVNRTIDAGDPRPRLTAPASIVRMTRAVSNLLSETRKMNIMIYVKIRKDTMQMWQVWMGSMGSSWQVCLESTRAKESYVRPNP